MRALGKALFAEKHTSNRAIGNRARLVEGRFECKFGQIQPDSAKSP